MNGLSLRIEDGEHIAILGPNGCGKSTLIKTITREEYPLLRPDSWLKIYGRDRWHLDELRQWLGIVSNDWMAKATRDVKGRELVLGGFFNSVTIEHYHEVTAEMRERADAALAEMGVSYLADRWTDELSSGEGRRVLLARALVHTPKALLLDEPGTSLDFAAQIHLNELVSAQARNGKTIVLVTHHLSDIIPEIERVAFLKAGQIIDDGPKREMLTTKKMSELFGASIEVVEKNGRYGLL
ncbi:ABC transporter ATP-binding protein [Bryobacter aggregatus]|uniref:ABC transporter ATP-binding protein n=1 Tax=Bryobacter aggregatus TaxID=360054 RepID=UPI001EE1A0B4|nr:ABC transporter ATP-binding protein [Bryobacter aggregatus]